MAGDFDESEPTRGERMAVHAVVKQGVYMHGFWAPLSRQEALVKAQALALAEGDSHHSFDVHLVTPEDGLGEREPIASYRRRPAYWWAHDSDWHEAEEQRQASPARLSGDHTGA